MVEESIIRAPMDRERLGFAYTIYLVTPESVYNVRLWESGLTQDFHQSSPLPKGAQTS